MTLNGFLVVDKPAGWTSHDVVARVRRLLGEKKIGHAGTLDPAAVGVLPLAIGTATRTLEYVAEADKAYIADIRFGTTTDSYDIEGVVQDVRDCAELELEQILTALEQFRGEILQKPPAHSARRVAGKRAYQIARSGNEVVLEPRSVTIHNISVISWNKPELQLEISCSKGTYIRSLAHDLGEQVGTGAMLSRLVRIRVGGFTLRDATTIDQISPESWSHRSFPPDAALHHMHVVVLNNEQRIGWGYGKLIPCARDAGTVRVYDTNGKWLGIGSVRDAFLHPHKVVSGPEQ